MFMRYTSPNETRTISREDLGFYNALIIGGVYEIENEKVDVRSPRSFIPPLKKCILDEPYLSVVVRNPHTEKPSFEGVSSINLENHISIVHSSEASQDSDNTAIEKALQPILDRQWPANIPPWRIVVIPLASSDSQVVRCFIAFSMSHAIGDGMCGIAFHRSFLKAWKNTAVEETESFVLDIPNRSLPEPFDTPERLPISWKFLLGPLIAVLLPKILVNLFGLSATTSTITPGTWTGTRMFHDSNFTSSSRVCLLEIEAPLVKAALQASRAHSAKLTATIHQLIVNALSTALPNPEITNFVAGTAIDMRRSVGIPSLTWGLHVSGHYETYPRPSPTEHEKPTISPSEWTHASKVTKNLAECSTRLQDQAIGLLRYAPSIRKWTADKIGAERDCSYRVSNILAFDSQEHEGWRISKMVFSTPADAVGAPINFDLISVKGGSLVVAVGWQAGALEVDGGEGGEQRFVDMVCESLKEGFEGLRG